MSDHDNYFHDSNGQMWVNISQTDRVTINTIGHGEIILPVCDIWVGKHNTELCANVTTEGQENLDEYVDCPTTGTDSEQTVKDHYTA